MVILGWLGVSIYFQGILYIVGCIFSLEVLPKCCGGEYVHHRLCLGYRSHVTCGVRLYYKAFLVKNTNMHYGVCLHPVEEACVSYGNFGCWEHRFSL